MTFEYHDQQPWQSWYLVHVQLGEGLVAEHLGRAQPPHVNEHIL